MYSVLCMLLLVRSIPRQPTPWQWFLDISFTLSQLSFNLQFDSQNETKTSHDDLCNKQAIWLITYLFWHWDTTSTNHCRRELWTLTYRQVLQFSVQAVIWAQQCCRSGNCFFYTSLATPLKSPTLNLNPALIKWEDLRRLYMFNTSSHLLCHPNGP